MEDDTPLIQVVINAIYHVDKLLHDNLILSKRRAKAIEEFLLQEGVKNKLVAIGKGDSTPIADNKSKEGRQKNRRVEINLIK